MVHTLTPTERFRTLIRQYGGTQVKFAERLGVTQSTVTAWVQRNTMTKKASELIMQHCPEISYVWLMTGQGTMMADGGASAGHGTMPDGGDGELRRLRSEQGDEVPDGDEVDERDVQTPLRVFKPYSGAFRTVTRKFYPNIFASCGRYEQFDDDEMAVDIQMLDNGSEMYINAEGCSMEPTIHDGDMIGVRSVGDTEPFKEDNIYLIVTREGERMLKRIKPNNPASPTIEIFTDNDEYRLAGSARLVNKADVLFIYRVTFVGTCL